MQTAIFTYVHVCLKLLPLRVRIRVDRLKIGFPGGSEGKEFTCNAGDPSSIPGSGRYPGEENGYPLLYSCLENPMDRRA